MFKRKVATFGFALKGLRIGFKEELNFRTQIVLGVIALLLSAYFKISVVEWLFVIATTSAVLTAELLNTALEELCDMLRSTHDPHVAKIKDLAAGAVLVSSCMALITGVIIFLPRILSI